MHPLVTELRKEMKAASDPAKAEQMRAYMKTDQPFFGLQAQDRRAIFREVLERHPIRSREEYERVIRELWRGEHREEMYQALEVAVRYKAYLDDRSWALYRDLVHSASHWDTLDPIAIKLVSPLVLNNREHERELKEWAASENLWVRRASLLAHMRHKDRTNKTILAQTILQLAQEQEFFIRKAIGWVLRELAKTDPDWVRDFVAEHESELSGLSKREARKYL